MRNPFRYFNSSPEVIRLTVMMYIRYPLSLRQVEDILFERGIDICHETIRFWWNRFGPLFANEIRKRRIQTRSYSHWRWLCVPKTSSALFASCYETGSPSSLRTCRERRVSLRLPGQPPSRGLFGLSVDALRMRSKNPRNVTQIGGAPTYRDQRDTSSCGQTGAYGLFSLLVSFRGHSLGCSRLSRIGMSALRAKADMLTPLRDVR